VGVIATPRHPVAVGAALHKELDIRWVWSYAAWGDRPEYQIALDLLAAGRLRAGPMLTHRFALDEITTAFQAACDRAASGAIKVLVCPTGEHDL